MPDHPRAGGPTRRRFFRYATAAAITSVIHTADAAPASRPRRAARPTPRYRVWFAPRLFDRDTDLYASMTLDAGGWLDPRLADLAGKTTLDWVYGLNHPEAKGPDYWRKACSVAGRSYPRKGGETTFISAGIAVDEWVPAKVP